jgi:hypothetical protein
LFSMAFRKVLPNVFDPFQRVNQRLMGLKTLEEVVFRLNTKRNVIKSHTFDFLLL